jgi:hypothetical protein
MPEHLRQFIDVRRKAIRMFEFAPETHSSLWHYAIVLSTDEAFTAEDAAEDEALIRSIGAQLTEAGIEYDMPYPLDPRAPSLRPV